MIDQGPSPSALLQRRLMLVATLSSLTARSHKLIQELSAAEMDMLRLELEIVRNPASTELVRELQDVQDHAADLRVSQSGCLIETLSIEAEMEEIDELIAAPRGGSR